MAGIADITSGPNSQILQRRQFTFTYDQSPTLAYTQSLTVYQNVTSGRSELQRRHPMLLGAADVSVHADGAQSGAAQHAPIPRRWFRGRPAGIPFKSIRTGEELQIRDTTGSLRYLAQSAAERVLIEIVCLLYTSDAADE